MNKQKGLTPILIILLIAAAAFGYLIYSGKISLKQLSTSQNKTQNHTNIEGRFCGGIAANLPENKCPEGYKCKLDGNYPDAGGKCVKK